MFLNGRFDNLQDTEEQMDKFYVTRFLLALRLEQSGLERPSCPKYLQTFVPYPHICPIVSVYYFHAFLCVLDDFTQAFIYFVVSCTCRTS